MCLCVKQRKIFIKLRQEFSCRELLCGYVSVPLLFLSSPHPDSVAWHPVSSRELNVPEALT